MSGGKAQIAVAHLGSELTDWLAEETASQDTGFGTESPECSYQSTSERREGVQPAWGEILCWGGCLTASTRKNCVCLLVTM